MKIIFLSNGKRAFIDDEDWTRLAKHNWHCHSAGYAFYWRKTGEKTSAVLMHREVMAPDADKAVHHRDGNRLNNQRSNLEILTLREHSERHQRSQGPRKGQYRGVCYLPKIQRWRAQIHCPNRKRFIGDFKCVVVAARAYDLAAYKEWGDETYLNFPCLRPLYSKSLETQRSPSDLENLRNIVLLKTR